MYTSRRTAWLIFITALFILSLGMAFITRRLAAPSDGARLQPGANALQPDGLVLTPLDLHPGGLQPGDRVIGAAGRDIETWAAGLLHPAAPRTAWETGTSLDYTIIRNGAQITLPVVLGRYPFWAIIRSNWGTVAFALAYLLVAAFVFWRRPQLGVAQVLLIAAAGVSSSTAWSFGLTVGDFTDGLGFWLFKAATLLAYNLYWTATFHFALIFPRPLPFLENPGPRRRWFFILIYGLPYLLLLAYLSWSYTTASGLLDWFSRWTVAEGAHAAVFLTAALVAMFLQYRREVTLVTRQQLRWVVLAGMLSGGTGLLLYILPGALGLGAVNPNIVGLIVIPFPIAIAIAILRHNLFDIDILINRTLVYGALTVSTIGMYVFFVGFVGGLVQAQGRSLIAFLVTGLVAVVFQPLREWLQRLVNRWMYGERDDPYAVLTRLGQRLEGVLVPGAVLPTIVETIAQTLKLPYVAIHWEQAGAPLEAVSYGLSPAGTPLERLPLVFQNEKIGELVLAQRAISEPFTPAEARLLRDLARQVEVAVHNVRLTSDLQRSRQRLVTAREEERRRIRRDLHDGLGPQLASQALALEAIEKLMLSDPAAAAALIQEVKVHSQNAVQDIRRLIYALRPPALDDLGLAAALQRELDRLRVAGLQIALHSPEKLPPLPAAVELAAYRIILEAVNNTLKHASAHRCDIHLEVTSTALRLSVADDGQGLPAQITPGIGLHAMRERAEELGGRLEIDPGASGGTQVTAHLPMET